MKSFVPFANAFLFQSKLDPENDHTAVITLTGLDADTLYSYRPVWDGEESNTKQNETLGRAVDPHQYSVTTMVPAQSSVSDLVFVFGSCTLSKYHYHLSYHNKPQITFKTFLQQNFGLSLDVVKKIVAREVSF